MITLFPAQGDFYATAPKRLSAQCDSVADMLGNIFSQRELRIATKVVNEVAVPEGALPFYIVEVNVPETLMRHFTFRTLVERFVNSYEVMVVYVGMAF